MSMDQDSGGRFEGSKESIAASAGDPVSGALAWFGMTGAEIFRVILRLGLGLILLGMASGAKAQEPEARISSKKVREEVRAVVEGQLTALRKGDLAAAYAFAASGIKRQFDVRLFGLLLKRGYAPLLRHEKSDLGVVRDDGAGTAQVTVTVIDRLNRRTVYLYWLVKEEAGWRISGVVPEQKPPPGDI